MNLDQRIPRKSADAQSGSGVTACFTKDLNEKIGRTVDDRGRVGESERGIHVAIYGEHFRDAVERTKLSAQNGKLSESASPRGGVAFLDGTVCAGQSGDHSFGAGRDDA